MGVSSFTLAFIGPAVDTDTKIAGLSMGSLLLGTGGVLIGVGVPAARKYRDARDARRFSLAPVLTPVQRGRGAKFSVRLDF